MVDHEQTEPVLANVSLKNIQFYRLYWIPRFLGHRLDFSCSDTLWSDLHVLDTLQVRVAERFGGVQSSFSEFVIFCDKTLFLQFSATKQSFWGTLLPQLLPLIER